MTESKKTKPGIELDIIKIPDSSTNGQAAKKPIVIGDPPSPEDVQQAFEITPGSERQKDTAKTEKPSKSRSTVWMLSFFLAVSAGAVIFFVWYVSPWNNQPGNDFLMPVDRLCIKLENSSLKLHASIQEVETLSVTIGSKSKIKQIIETIDTAKMYLNEFMSNIETFHTYTKNKRPGKPDEIEEYLIETGNFFLNDDYKHYIHILTEYLDVFKNYLTYYYKNFDEIKNKHPAKIRSTETLYIKYKRISNIYQNAETMNQANVKQLIGKYPKAARFFPSDQKGSIFKWTN